MKLPDLMLHDWAFDDIRKEPWQMEVSDFRRLYRQGSPPDDERFNEDGTFKHLHPLPLTEEMLKVNGFEIVDGWDCLYIIHGNIVFDYEHSTLNYILHDLAFPICDLTYVHELQHALRLCGLSELADNFKVE